MQAQRPSPALLPRNARGRLQPPAAGLESALWPAGAFHPLSITDSAYELPKTPARSSAPRGDCPPTTPPPPPRGPQGPLPAASRSRTKQRPSTRNAFGAYESVRPASRSEGTPPTPPDSGWERGATVELGERFGGGAPWLRWTKPAPAPGAAQIRPVVAIGG